MKFRNWLGLQFTRLKNRRDREQDLKRELQSHLELEAEEQQGSGLSPEEAGYAARQAFGNATVIAEDVRAISSRGRLEQLWRDVRHGARSLRKNPGFTVVAVLTLALGIGANTAIFSAIDALMLRPLPFTASDQLVRIYSTKNGVPISGTGYPGGPSALDERDFAQDSHSFQNMVFYDVWSKNVSFGTSGGQPEQMRVGLISAAYFEVLDVRPIMGRLFTDDENRDERRVAAISARLWRNRFAGDQAILGRDVRINDESYNIVAVMPDVIPDWMEPGVVEIWTPLSLADLRSEAVRGGRGYEVLARMKPGVSLEQAQTDLATVAAGLAAAHPVDEGIGVAIKSLTDTRVGAMRPVLFLLMGAVGLILLIACVNLAILLLARNSTRQRELAVRAALGAGRLRLVQQLLAETVCLALIGGTVGLLLAKMGIVLLARIHPKALPQLASVGIDWRVLIFTLSVSLVTSLLFGLAPAITGTRMNLVDALKQGGRSGSSGGRSLRLRNLLIVAEMAMSLMLLVGAGLLVQSIVRLQGQALGIRQDRLLKGHFYLSDTRYPNPGAITRFCDEFARRVRGLPGVVDASVTTIYPPNNGWTQMLEIPGHPATRIQDVPAAEFGVTDAHFLQTAGVPLIRGRGFSESDGPASTPVALISQQFVRRYFPNEDPVGRRIHIGPPQFLQMPRGENISDDADVTIIGVIGDFKNRGLAFPPDPQIIGLYTQHPLVNYGFKEILVRTAAEPRLLVPEIGGQLHQIDPDIPLAQVQTIDEVVEEQTGGQRFTTILLVLFAAVGLALMIVGTYGVISYLVTQRTRELAVRMAVGASPANVLWLILRQGLSMALMGAVIGLCGAFAARQLMSGLLFGVSPVDPATFIGGAVGLLLLAGIASAIPGLRAMRIPLVSALVHE
jgi:putative ABC transport system permease protein